MKELYTITANKLKDCTELIFISTQPKYSLNNVELIQEREVITDRLFVKNENIDKIIEALEMIKDNDNNTN